MVNFYYVMAPQTWWQNHQVVKKNVRENMAVLIGADPEFFLKHKKTRQNISAHGIVPGTKDKPHKLALGALQLDGTAVEFNIEPAASAHEFKRNIESVLGQIRKMVPEKYDFNFSPAVIYGKKYFDKRIPEDSKILGCNPDHDAYNKGKHNKMPSNVGTMRTGAGHVHIGWTNGADPTDVSHLVDCMLVTRNMDALIAPIEHLWDKDTLRRKMYGKLGCFRPKPYGVEYRSLSNAWVKHPELYDFIFDTAKYAHTLALHGYDIQKDHPVFKEKLFPLSYNFVVAYTGVGLGKKPKLPTSIKGVY